MNIKFIEYNFNFDKNLSMLCFEVDGEKVDYINYFNGEIDVDGFDNKEKNESIECVYSLIEYVKNNRELFKDYYDRLDEIVEEYID